MSDSKKYRYSNINNKEIIESEIIHPFNNKKHKIDNEINIINFCKDLNIDYKSINRYKGSNKIFNINIDNVNYTISLEHCDGGGNDRTDKLEKLKNPRKKIEIPFANKVFKELLENFEKLLVINVYVPLKDNKLDYSQRIYTIIKPKEILNSKSFKKQTWNSSSRWVRLEEILGILNWKNYKINNSKNVFIVHPLMLKKIINEKIKTEYLECYNSELKILVDQWIRKKEFTESEQYQKFRKIFREKLLTERGLKCEMLNCYINGTNLLNASHIKPVNAIVHDITMNIKDKEEEIVDSNNGFLLCPTHDRLFDRFLISFTSKDGCLLIGEQVESQSNFLNLKNKEESIKITSQNMSYYLEYHNDVFYEKNHNQER